MAKMAKMMGFSRGVDVMRVSSAGRAIDGRRTERHGGCTGLRSFVRGRVLERGATATAFASTSPAVLLTREESKNDKLRALLEGRGYETFELPLVEHTRNEGGRADLVHELAGGEGRVDWFITTSPEAGLYRCGSTPAPIMPTTLTRSPPTSFTMSVTMVVVATTFILAAVDCVRPAAATNPSVNVTMRFIKRVFIGKTPRHNNRI